MATAPVKPPLHNFSLSFLKWGTTNNVATNHHRHRRPVSAEPPASSEPDNSESERAHSNNNSNNRVGSSSHAARLRPSLIPCSDATTKRGKSEERENEDAEEEEGAEAVQKPWNLRPRRALATAMVSFAKASSAIASSGSVAGVAGASGERQEREGPNPNPNPSPSEGQQQPKSKRLRGLGEGGQNVGDKKEKRKFWIALSKEEIEEDIFIMTGSRPARRPKKRARNVQKQLDSIFPGLWLVGYSADAYHADSPSKR